MADRTQLPQEIQLTEVGQYHYLLDQVADHQRCLQGEQGRPLSFKEAALDWYRTIYRPLCAIIDRGGLVESFSGRTRADLYAYISVHHWQQGRQRKYGSAIDSLIPQNMEEFRNKMADSKQFGYPEMQRGVTAFVLMNVQARRESKIVQKLFELAQVREIHSVHGDVDLLVKIELTRDLLSSDAEIISQFVHEKVGQLPGVKNTKTLIPGFSKIKPPLMQESPKVAQGLHKRGV